MQKNKTYRSVGMFVFVGLFILGAIIYRYVSKTFLTKDSEYPVMYFEESINGLNVGSPVVFKGVEVGQVIGIRLVVDMEKGTFKTPVYAEFIENRSFEFKDKRHLEPREALKDLISKGLRARLVSGNYLTGQLMIELVMDPNTPVEFDGYPDEPEIPTIMSSFGVISKDLQEIPLKETMLRISNIIEDLEEKMPDILKNVADISSNMSKLTTKMDKMMDKKSDETSKAVANFNNTLEDIAKASVSLKNLTDYLERHPEAIIRGKESAK